MFPDRMTLLFTALLLASASLPPDSLSQSPRAMTDISAPVVYESTMLVLVSDDGVAAVVFRPTADGGTAYDFRFEGTDGEKLEGAGKPLFEARTPKGDLTGELCIKAGPISVGWSKGGDAKEGASKGWIYYTPEKAAGALS